MPFDAQGPAYHDGSEDTGQAVPLTPEEMAALRARAYAAAPDLKTAKAFWSALSPNDPAIRLRFLKHDRSAPPHEVYADSIEAVWPKVVELQAAGYEAYYFLNVIPPGNGCGWAGFATDDDVTAIRALAADFDDGVPVDAWEWHAPPDLVVNSSVVNGVRKGQALWLVADCPVEEFTAAQERLIAYYGSDKSITNPSRILRLPGSLHQKDPTHRQLVTFLANAVPAPRPLAELTAALPEAAPRKSTAPVEDRHEVPVATLMDVLPYIDPSVPGRSRWMGIISGFKNTDFTGGDDSFDAEDVVVRWSAGEFWNGPKDAPRWLSDGTPANFEGGTEKHPIPGDVAAREAFLTSNGNATFGTLVFHAKENGWSHQPAWDGEIVHSYIPPAADVIQEPPPKPKPSRVKLWRVSQIMKWPEPVELVEGLLIERENVAFVGTPKSGKTFIALDCALSIAAGVPVLGTKRINRRGIVIYLSGEGHGGMQARITAWLKHRKLNAGVLEDYFFYNKGVPITTESEEANLAQCAEFVAAVREHEGEPVLVVIDTMARSLRGADENSAPAANLYLDMTETLRNALDCTVLTIAHASNKGKADGDDFRGSSAFSAGFDSTWTTKKNEANGTVQLKAKYLKEADETRMAKVFFQLTQIPFGDGRVGVALEPVNEAVFLNGRDGETGQFASKSTETPEKILSALSTIKDDRIKGTYRPDCHARGIGHKELAELLLADSKPEGTGQPVMDWLTQVNNCAERVRKCAGKKEYDHLGSKEVPGIGAGKNEWRWWIRAPVIDAA